MIAIVTLDQTPNILTITSIFISMISVASKSFVFSAAVSYNIKTLLFTWLCAVLDFFAIFFIVSWIFKTTGNHVDNGDNAFLQLNIVGEIWIYKILISVLPMVIIGSISAAIVAFMVSISNFVDKYRLLWHRCFVTMGILIVITLLVSFGIVCAAILLEIACFVWVGIVMYGVLGNRYYENDRDNLIMGHIRRWILSETKSYKIPYKYLTVEQQKALKSFLPLTTGIDNIETIATGIIDNEKTNVTSPDNENNKSNNDKPDTMVNSHSNINSMDTAVDINDTRNENKSRNGKGTPGTPEYLNVTRKMDKIIRICCVMRCIINEGIHNEYVLNLTVIESRIHQHLERFLKQHESTFYSKVKLSDISRVVAQKQDEQFAGMGGIKYHAQPLKHFEYLYCWWYNDALKRYKKEAENGQFDITYRKYQILTGVLFAFTYFLVPLYLLCKVINIVFPILCILYVYGMNENNNVLLNEIDTFEWIMFGVYCSLFLIWFILFITVFQEEYYMRHVMPHWDMIDPYTFSIYSRTTVVNCNDDRDNSEERRNNVDSSADVDPVEIMHMQEEKIRENEQDNCKTSKISKEQNKNEEIKKNELQNVYVSEDVLYHRDYYWLPLTMKEYYDELMIQPSRNGVIIEFFDKNIGNIIIEYVEGSDKIKENEKQFASLNKIESFHTRGTTTSGFNQQHEPKGIKFWDVAVESTEDLKRLLDGEIIDKFFVTPQIKQARI